METNSAAQLFASMNSYHLIGAFLLAIFSSFQPARWAIDQQNFPVDTYLWWGLSISVVLIARSNIAGCMRYSLNTYHTNFLRYVQQSPKETLLIGFVIYLIGVPRQIILTIAAVTWRYAYEYHCEAVGECTRWAEQRRLQVELLLGNAQREIAALQSYEAQGLTMAQSAIRDSRQAQNIHAIDLFDESCKAWTGLRRIVVAAEEAAIAAQNASFTADEYAEMLGSSQDSDSGDESDDDADEEKQPEHQKPQQAQSSGSNPKVEQAQKKWEELYRLAEDAEREVKLALHGQEEFQKAKDLVTARRQLEESNVTQVLEATEMLSSYVKEAQEIYRGVIESAQEARDLTSKAVGEISMGKVPESKSLEGQVDEILRRCAGKLTSIGDKVNLARKQAKKAAGKHWGGGKKPVPSAQ